MPQHDRTKTFFEPDSAPLTTRGNEFLKQGARAHRLVGPPAHLIPGLCRDSSAIVSATPDRGLRRGLPDPRAQSTSERPLPPPSARYAAS